MCLEVKLCVVLLVTIGIQKKLTLDVCVNRDIVAAIDES